MTEPCQHRGPGPCEHGYTNELGRLRCPAKSPQTTATRADELAGNRISTIHIAGPDITIGPYLRQRCAWCGTVLIDYNLDQVAVPDGQDPRPGTWPIGALIATDGPASWSVDHTDGNPLPAGACARLDPEATL